MLQLLVCSALNLFNIYGSDVYLPFLQVDAYKICSRRRDLDTDGDLLGFPENLFLLRLNLFFGLSS
ncbi:MAG: hypothetical protein QXQ42_05580 [Candidatus Bathyarchaeia archaeon]